ncbi:MAG: trehalose-6-phosphate synthase [Candidatus Omnitrophica bacterium]|nr:trehalose-6-phosphate synthase [Candidatus Omnitrophota bacterium]
MIRERLGNELFVVVSNREPYIHRFEGEEILCQVPASGLTIALDPVMRACGGLWVAHGSGEADRQVVDNADHVQVPPEEPSYTLRRVWLTKEEENGYYYGFANEGLWPLCHIAYTRPSFNAEDWSVYRDVNRKFADAVLGEIGDRNAFVFIQDYHLALLSRLLKRANIRTAQFWHIPWPNREAFRICPWAEEILDGLLGNDLLGFHIQYHCLNFLDAVDRMIEARVDYERSEVTRGGLVTMVRPFPISIDFERVAERAADAETQAEMGRLKRRFGLRDRLIGLGVDRIDYTKGIPERLRAVDRFLGRHPEFQKRFVFVEVGVPSRVHIEAYQRINDEIDQLVESINWKYQTGNWKPILYLKEHARPATLQAWYRLAHLCAVTSLHDGMNLVAKEFVASRVREDGVLILSRFTGAARELADAELVNPYGIDEIAEALYRAAVMSPQEQQRRMRRLRSRVGEQNIYRWAGHILSTLFKFEFQEA